MAELGRIVGSEESASKLGDAVLHALGILDGKFILVGLSMTPPILRLYFCNNL